ncbi:MAG: flagellar hook-basal body complex protein FliE [Oscillospiraceae bacterium]|nr:flagellar hook-basal body complex protein FliE [Oscillospiraceae bacterium]
MFIVPLNNTITPLNTPSQIGSSEKAQGGNDNSENVGGFLDIFRESYDAAAEAQRVSEEDSIKVMTGEIDDPAQIAINAQKAALSLQTFVSLKNTAVDAYKEMMQIQL